MVLSKEKSSDRLHRLIFFLKRSDSHESLCLATLNRGEWFVERGNEVPLAQEPKSPRTCSSPCMEPDSGTSCRGGGCAPRHGRCWQGKIAHFVLLAVQALPTLTRPLAGGRQGGCLGGHGACYSSPWGPAGGTWSSVSGPEEVARACRLCRDRRCRWAVSVACRVGVAVRGGCTREKSIHSHAASGMVSYLLPGLGESEDVVGAPISALLVQALYGSYILTCIDFLEEALPFTDAVPTATLGWCGPMGMPLGTEAHRPGRVFWLLLAGLGARGTRRIPPPPGPWRAHSSGVDSPAVLVGCSSTPLWGTASGSSCGSVQPRVPDRTRKKGTRRSRQQGKK